MEFFDFVGHSLFGLNCFFGIDGTISEGIVASRHVWNK